MKILKVYAKCACNGMQLKILDNINSEIAEELFIDTIKEEHEKQNYEMDIDGDDEQFDEKVNKLYNKTLDKCMEYAKEHKVNYFGDYEIVLLDDEEGIESPNIIGTYTFYEEMGQHLMTKDDIEKLKQSEFVRDVLKPFENLSENLDKAKEELTNPNSEYNKINRGEKV